MHSCLAGAAYRRHIRRPEQASVKDQNKSISSICFWLSTFAWAWLLEWFTQLLSVSNSPQSPQPLLQNHSRLQFMVITWNRKKLGFLKIYFCFIFLNHLMEHVTGWYPMLLLELWNICFIHDLPDFFLSVCILIYFLKSWVNFVNSQKQYFVTFSLSTSFHFCLPALPVISREFCSRLVTTARCPLCA